ncbi:hypothetical protein MA16_Dca003324 [Dendrobium catenatum]|uniref:Uncharacterized protein n=1 Tax=Dendrobium catenatum TaxID=906689 RepID=A0A2I0XCF9_9ASPA|nr:hypothetical protein MA16_Dca003324 [Dendrobium catenatum]
MKDLGAAHQFLGIKIESNQDTTGKTPKSGCFFRRLLYINRRFFAVPAASWRFFDRRKKSCRKLSPTVFYRRFIMAAVYRRLRPPVTGGF